MEVQIENLCNKNIENKIVLQESSALIQEQIKNVGKLVVTEGIPDEEIKINPDLEYFDVQSGYLNPFEAHDYNAIKTTVKASLLKKVDASDLKSNAKNRLISELSKFYILTNSLGWTLRYNQNPLETLESLNGLKL